MGNESTHWRTGIWGDDVVHQVRRRLCHAAGPARVAKAAPLARAGGQLVVAAVAAAQPQKAVGLDAALQEGVELVLDELRQLLSRGSLSLLEEGRGMLLHRSSPGKLLTATNFGESHRPAIGCVIFNPDCG